ELVFQDSQNQMELMDREAAPPQVGEHEQLEEVDRRVAPLGVAAGRRAVRRDGRRHQPARIPHLQLTGSETGERRHLARAVGFFQLHASRSAVAAPSKSLIVSPPSLCVEYVSVTRL